MMSKCRRQLKHRLPADPAKRSEVSSQARQNYAESNRIMNIGKSGRDLIILAEKCTYDPCRFIKMEIGNLRTRL